jgi:hypothetical protein
MESVKKGVVEERERGRVGEREERAHTTKTKPRLLGM